MQDLTTSKCDYILQNRLLGYRLMVGQRPLKPLIGVRIPVSQLSHS